jgi:hypothetical protein
MTKLLVIGEICIDEYIYGTCDRVCPEAAAMCFRRSPEPIKQNYGMAGNVFENIKSIDSLSNISLLSNDKSVQPIVKRRFVDLKYNTIVFREDINDTCESIQLDKYDFSKYDCIVFSDYCKGFLSYSDIIDICKRKNNECITFMDTKKKLNDFVKYIDFVKINSKEFSMNILDLKNINSLCSLIVTTGENGANFYNKGNSQFINYPAGNVLGPVTNSQTVFNDVNLTCNFMELSDSAMAIIQNSLQGKPVEWVCGNYANYIFNTSLGNSVANVSMAVPAKFNSLKSLLFTFRPQASASGTGTALGTAVHATESLKFLLQEYDARIGSRVVPSDKPNTISQFYSEFLRAISSVGNLDHETNITPAMYTTSTSVATTSSKFAVGFDLESYSAVDL